MGKKRNHDGSFHNAHGQVVDEPLDYTEWLERDRDRVLAERDMLREVLTSLKTRIELALLGEAP